jgi:DNA primase
MDILTLAQGKTQLRKTASTHGGEYVGPCPSCGGRDRFHVWPDKTDSKRSERVGIYWCRSCGKAGDVIRFLVDFDGKTYAEAFAAICEEMPSDGRHKYAAPQPQPAPRPCTSNAPGEKRTPQSDTWLAKAAALVQHAQAELAANDFAQKWLARRGISADTAAAMRLGWLSEDRWRDRPAWGLSPEIKADGKAKRLWIPGGLVIPLIDQDGAVRRIRIRRFGDQEPRYVVVPGSSMVGMAHGFPNRAAVIVESELDAIMLAGLAPDLAAVVALGSASTKPGAQLLDELQRCAVVLVALDSDRAGAEAMRWWREHLTASRRWPVPHGKDPGEAFASGVDIREWLKAGMPAGWFFGPSSIGLVHGRGAEPIAEAAAEKAPPVETPAPAAAEEPLDELARLLRDHPVQVRVAPDASRVWIRESQGWRSKNWETSRRISQLVFMNNDVLDYLINHGAEIISGKNFKK